MKHSHKVLIALTALVAALILFFWPRTTAAAPLAVAFTGLPAGVRSDAPLSFETRCQQLSGSRLSVTATAPGYALTTGLSTRVLSARSDGASSLHQVMGMTASRTRADILIDGAALLDASSGRECFVPRVEVELRFEPMDVYVAREFSQQSCAYRTVLRHEMEHVNLYARQLLRIEALVREELLRRHGGGGPVYGVPGKGMAALQAEINAWLDPLLRDEMKQVERMQVQLDTPEETEKLSHACLGEVAMMMGSSF